MLTYDEVLRDDLQLPGLGAVEEGAGEAVAVRLGALQVQLRVAGRVTSEPQRPRVTAAQTQLRRRRLLRHWRRQDWKQ